MATQYGNGYVAARRSNRWQDWAELILAIWLFISPWVLNFGAGSGASGGAPGAVANAAWNAWVMAVLTFLVALSAIGRMEVWQEWLALIFGAWVFIAPWVLGFTNLAAASWDHWIVGALIFLVAACSLAVTDRATSRETPPPPKPIS